MPERSAPRPTFVQSDRRLARYVARPVRQFSQIEAAGGIVLLVATVAAIVWANSPWRAGYAALFGTEISLHVGTFHLEGDVVHWINDGLMAVFFLVVGLEIKREWVTGELRDRRAAALPIIGAIGGMALPPLIYLLVQHGGPSSSGWGIPMATDIAFALGVVAVLGSRVPASLKVFLLTLAVVDDIGAVVVIAVFYTESLRPWWLIGAAAAVLLVMGLRRAHVVYQPAYVAVGLALWICAYESGIHPTLAGVVMGLLAPAVAFDGASSRRNVSEPVTERVLEALHPWTSYLIVPLFALANAGIELNGDRLFAGEPVTVGVIVGLVVGKTVGVAGSAWLATRLGLGRLPDGVSWSQLIGIAVLAGIGFTVSLFVSGLAFDSASRVDDAKVGVLTASVMAAALGSTVLLLSGRRDRAAHS